MESNMDIDVARLLKRRYLPPNFITGVFLKNVYFLNSDYSKFAVAGLFQNKGYALGLSIYSKRGCLFWTYNTLNQLVPLVSLVSNALSTSCGKHVSRLETGEEMIARKLFGKWYVNLSDGINNVTFSVQEWNQFVGSLPSIMQHLEELTSNEESATQYIVDSLALSNESSNPTTPSDSLRNGEQLRKEITYFKQFPISSSSTPSSSQHKNTTNDPSII